MIGNGGAGPQAVDAWVAAHAVDVERIRTSVHDIAASGLTVSKVSVAASLLNDLLRN
jgi:glutamate dehydrogenase